MLAFQPLGHFRACLATSITDMWEWRRVRFRVILVPEIFSGICISDRMLSWPLKQSKTSTWLVQEIQIWRLDKCPKIVEFGRFCGAIGSNRITCDVTPRTAYYLHPGNISFSYVETHKVSPSNRWGVHVLLHKPCHEEVHSARSSSTALEQVRNWRK